MVVIRSKRLLGKQDPKGPLAPPKSGPFKIIGQITETSFRLKLPPKYKNISDAFHADQLVPYNARVEEAPSTEPIPPRLAADEEIIGEDDPIWDPIAAPPILPDVAPPPNANDPPTLPLQKMQKVQVSSGDWIEVLQEPKTYRRNEAGEIEVVIPPHAPEPEAAQRLPQVKIADPNAAAVDAFMQNWAAEKTPHANPPWSLIPPITPLIS